MKKGKVISLNISHKNGSKILYTGDKVSELDVNDFDKLVKGGHIEVDAATKKAEAAKKAEEEKAKAEAAKK